MSENDVLLERRLLLAGLAGISLSTLAAPVTATSATATKASSTSQRRAFPKGFRWGVATAAYQIEGNNLNSDYWLLERVQPTTFAEPSGDACDSYHRYEEDIALLASLGLNTYRFSIEWARIEPARGAFSVAELDYYKRLIDCCRHYHIDPAVTFFHGTAPRWFAEAGGWLNPEAPDLFARYCSTAARALAADMAFAFTINEPQVEKTFRAVPQAAAYFKEQDEVSLAMHAAAAKASGSERFVTSSYPDIDGLTPQLIAGHERAVAAIKAERSSLPVGVTLSIIDFQPGTNDSPYEQIRALAYDQWFEVTTRVGDFTGTQVYQQLRLPGKGAPLPAPPPMPFKDPTNPMDSMLRPEALGNVVQYVYAKTHKPVFVTENGLETTDDERRCWYIRAALDGLQQAIASGTPVLGYIHWSLLDNFEWARGYKPRFGLASVDRTTFKRTAKPSAAVLGGIARQNAI